MSKTINRIIQLLDALNLSARQFDLSIGSGNGYTLRMQKNNASVGSDVIERIIKEYPQINLVWLMTGKGDMFVSQPEAKPLRSITEIKASIDARIKAEASETDKKTKALLKELQKEIDDIISKG